MECKDMWTFADNPACDVWVRSGVSMHGKPGDIGNCYIPVKDVVTRKEDQCGVGGEGVALCILRESETGLWTTWCVRSRLDVVGPLGVTLSGMNG